MWKFFFLRVCFLAVWATFFVSTSAPAQLLSDRTLFLILHVNGNSFTVKEKIVKNLLFHAVTGHPSDSYRVTLLSQDNHELYTASFFDPLTINVDDFSDPLHPKGGKESLSESTFHLKTPYLPNTARIRFERKNPNTGEWLPMGTSPLKLP